MRETNTSIVRQDLLHVADVVAREKSIEREEVFIAMEQAIEKIAKAKYGHENDIRVSIDRHSGAIEIACHRLIVESDPEDGTQIPLSEAKRVNENYNVGDEFVEYLPPVEFGRVAAQTAKQVIVQRVREAERLRQYNEYKDRVGEIINAVVKRVEYGTVTVDLGRAEAVIRKEDLIPRETFRVGDRVRAYIAEVRHEMRGAQIYLSRTAPQFMAKLFAQEVPEVYDGLIEIKSVARDPGSRAKIAVNTSDPSIDPVGACVGVRGARVQAIVNELQGEKVDIVLWSSNPATFVVNSLAPAEVSKVVVDEDSSRIEVVVPDEQLSLAIGRRGQNVKLASILSGWNIDILTEAQESERRQKEFLEASKLFVDALDIEDVMAHLLVTEGFVTIEDIAYTELAELSSIEGFDEDVARELQTRASKFIEQRDEESRRICKELGLTKELEDFVEFSPENLLKLANNGVKTLDDFADLASDELIDILGTGVVSLDQANDLIMKAREHWFE